MPGEIKGAGSNPHFLFQQVDSQHTSFAYHPLEKKVGSDHARNLLSLVMQCGGYEEIAWGNLLFWTFSARARARRAARAGA